MSEQFTPGPWTVAREYSLKPDGWPVKSGGHVVALAQYLGGTDPALRNANLIASAPQLFEAALDTVEALKLLRVGMLDNRHAVEVIDAHLDELETALAKARGEQSVMGRAG